MVQVIRLVRVVQVIRCPGGQVVRVVRVATLDAFICFSDAFNIWFSCPKSSNN